MSDNLRPIALDVDGVLFKYYDSYAKLWKRVFGEDLVEVDPNAYWTRDRYNARFLDANELAHFDSFKDEEFWTTMTPIDGALEACWKLKELFPGVKLFAVSALAPESNPWRKQNLLDLKFPIDESYATGQDMATELQGPKTFLLNKMMPRYYVDDQLSYFRGLNPAIRRVLIHRCAHDRRSFNHDPLMLAKTHGRHKDLKDWVDYLSKDLEKPA